MNKYLLIYRSPADAASNYQPSPEEVQEQLKQWQAWKEKFSENMVELGDGLLASGRVLDPEDVVRDGPFVEAKEVVGGFSIVQCADYEKAIEIAKACPVRFVPGNSVEVRQMAEY